MLRQLHLRLPDGQWLVGADASVEAWRYTRVGWLLKPLRWPVFGPVVDRVYRRWAKRRFKRLYGSGRYLCTLPEEAQTDPCSESFGASCGGDEFCRLCALPGRLYRNASGLGG